MIASTKRHVSDTLTIFFSFSDKLRWADTVSETPTRILISQKETSCFMIYGYVCYYCTLQVNITGQRVQSFSGKSQKSLQSRWQHLKYEPKTDVEIKFWRETTNGDE